MRTRPDAPARTLRPATALILLTLCVVVAALSQYHGNKADHSPTAAVGGALPPIDQDREPPRDRAPGAESGVEVVEVAERGAATGAVRVGSPRGAHVPENVLAAYRAAEDLLDRTHPDCGLRWYHLAAIGRIESGHARGGRADVRGDTSPRIHGPALSGGPEMATIRDTDGGRLDGDMVWDRAVGPMQFIPSTWVNHGVDANGDGRADPHNLYDATASAGRYLCSGGTDLSDAKALNTAVLRYNNSRAYLGDVLAWMHTYSGGATPVPARPAGPQQPVPPAVQAMHAAPVQAPIQGPAAPPARPVATPAPVPSPAPHTATPPLDAPGDSSMLGIPDPADPEAPGSALAAAPEQAFATADPTASEQVAAIADPTAPGQIPATDESTTPEQAPAAVAPAIPGQEPTAGDPTAPEQAATIDPVPAEPAQAPASPAPEPPTQQAPPPAQAGGTAPQLPAVLTMLMPQNFLSALQGGAAMLVPVTPRPPAAHPAPQPPAGPAHHPTTDHSQIRPNTPTGDASTAQAAPEAAPGPGTPTAAGEPVAPHPAAPQPADRPAAGNQQAAPQPAQQGDGHATPSAATPDTSAPSAPAPSAPAPGEPTGSAIPSAATPDAATGDAVAAEPTAGGVEEGKGVPTTPEEISALDLAEVCDLVTRAQGVLDADLVALLERHPETSRSEVLHPGVSGMLTADVADALGCAVPEPPASEPTGGAGEATSPQRP